jgi:hypothetical protein
MPLILSAKVVKQQTINDFGEEVTKFRSCYDLSYLSRGMKNSSINDRHRVEEIHSIQYSFALFHILHFVVALRSKNPNTPILFQKFDVDSAFKRLSLHFLSALKTIITLGNLAYISLQSTFGGKSSCSNFSLLAKPMADLINEAYSTNHLQGLSKPLCYIAYNEDPEVLDDNIPFKLAPILLFDIPTMSKKMVDLYVDDFIEIYLHKTVNGAHEATYSFNIITNVFDLIFKYADSTTPNGIKRACAMSLRKLRGEGISLEIKIILEWIINSRILTIVLLPSKRDKWIMLIKTIL